MMNQNIKLSDKEIDMLLALKVLGYKWLARDSNNILFAYDKKPVKLTTMWDIDLNWCFVKTYRNLFCFIKWKDTKPTKIDHLLKEYNK